ncbi:class C sortase [Bombiscardovia coagulans]|uniref:class C sortase n=1 Tax=Bombiscardovia coagulans TaxID=686666 RepID=UPI0011D170C9|nr:class C sortase [Bombiscardovia coagulans]
MARVEQVGYRVGWWQRVRRGQWWSAVLVFVLVAAGVSALVYPSAASWVAQYEQSRLIGQGVPHEGQVSAQEEQRYIQAAYAYNNALHAGAAYRANTNQPFSQQGKDLHERYEQTLPAGRGLMARLQVPSIRVDVPVYHGTSDATLLMGIGHLEGTSVPVGGSGTHAVLTGHRGLAQATLFTNLDKVKVGDQFTISSFHHVVTYQVVNTQVVEPEQTRSLQPVEGQDLVTLVTCTPLGINTQRIFVTGQRVFPTPVQARQAAVSKPSVPSFPWWLLVLVVVLVADSGWLVVSVKQPGKHGWLAGKREQTGHQPTHKPSHQPSLKPSHQRTHKQSIKRSHRPKHKLIYKHQPTHQQPTNN